MWTITQFKHKPSKPWLRALHYVRPLNMSDITMKMHHNLKSYGLNNLSYKIHHHNSEPGPLLSDPHSVPSTSFRQLLISCSNWLRPRLISILKIEAVCSYETIQCYKPEDRTIETWEGTGDIERTAKKKELVSCRLYKITNKGKRVEHNQVKDGDASSADGRRSPK
jgi:hypothetical protein